jgi:excisionase family DNA binding protein
MELSLTDAARLLGKSPRQVRYLIKNGKLTATKDGARWRIQSEDLPLSEGQLRARARKAQDARDLVEQALGPHGRLADKRYSVRDLRAFQAGAPLLPRLTEALGTDHPATTALRDALVALAQGCHRYHDTDKRDAYHLAREHASRATALVLLSGQDAATDLADGLEHQLMPAITGLVRRTERPGRRK